MWLNIRTAYSLKSVFGDFYRIIKRLKEIRKNIKYAGIADIASTLGFIRWNAACKKNNIKPVFGVRLKVSDLHPTGEKIKRYHNSEVTFIAKNTEGIKEIYNLVDLAYSQFYQFPKITFSQLNKTTKNIIVILGSSLEFPKIKREFYFQLSPDTPIALREFISNQKVKCVACIDNYFPFEGDKTAYESFVYGQYTGESKTSAMHILTDKEWKKTFPELPESFLLDALEKRNTILEECSNAELPIAPMVKYSQDIDPNKFLKEKCKEGIKERKLKLNKEYKKRLKRELKTIKEKNFADYFLIVFDLIRYCKKEMVVGHARGSSAGSLICYLLGITEIDPIKYNLLFERFIDINRFDLPDIDFDLQDTKREKAIQYLQIKYGSECVAQISNINRLQPKSAIIRTAKALHIPHFDIEAFKESIEDRPEGDERASKAIEDAFNESKIGRDILDLHPNFYHVKDLEGHPAHIGIHAAGIIVCPEPIKNYCGINNHNKNNLAMVDKRDAEKINLLKIDALGLTTLNTLALVCDQLKKPYSWLYSLPLDDKKTYKLINSGNLTGIFQMEGSTLRNLASGIKISSIDDLSALSALCRPGPLSAGAATKWIEQKKGKIKPEYLSSHDSVIKWTKETFGNVIYQEQLMGIVKEYGNLSWEDVTKVRKLMGKSQGDEAFSTYKEQFINGATESKEKAENVWNALKGFGQYGFNKSHSIAYAHITFITAYLKAHFPLEFAVGILNNTKNNSTALKILRDLKENQNIEYVPFDIHISEKEWVVYKGKLYGGLTTIEGIGPQAANTIVKCRKENKSLPSGIMTSISQGKTPFKYLYPGQELYSEYYSKKSKFGKASFIKDIHNEGEYVFIGMLIKRDIRDLNDSSLVVKRKGERIAGPTSYISMKMEDDTDEINVSIGRFEFEEIANIVTDEVQLNKDWFVVYGNLAKNRRFYIKDIKKITKEI